MLYVYEFTDASQLLSTPEGRQLLRELLQNRDVPCDGPCSIIGPAPINGFWRVLDNAQHETPSKEPEAWNFF